MSMIAPARRVTRFWIALAWSAALGVDDLHAPTGRLLRGTAEMEPSAGEMETMPSSRRLAPTQVVSRRAVTRVNSRWIMVRSS